MVQKPGRHKKAPKDALFARSVVGLQNTSFGNSGEKTYFLLKFLLAKKKPNSQMPDMHDFQRKNQLEKVNNVPEGRENTLI